MMQDQLQSLSYNKFGYKWFKYNHESFHETQARAHKQIPPVLLDDLYIGTHMYLYITPRWTVYHTSCTKLQP